MDAVERNARNAQKETAEGTSTGKLANARFSIQKIDGKDIVVIDTDQDIFEGIDDAEYEKVVRSYMREHFRGKEINEINFTRRGENEYTHSNSTAKLYNEERLLYKAKMHAATELDNLVRTGQYLGHEKSKHPRVFNEGGYDRYKVQFILNSKQFAGELLVAIEGQGKKIFYDIVNIKKRGNQDFTEDISVPSMKTSSTHSIRENNGEVNTFDEKTSKNSSRYHIDVDLMRKYPNLDLNIDISKMDGIPAIQLTDGSVLPFTETHIQFIKKNNIDVVDIKNGGFISKGIYEATGRSDTLRYKEQELAKRRMAEKRNAQSFDSDGNSLTKEQQEYFKDSKVRDKNGNLLVVYHGTNSREEKSVWNRERMEWDTSYAQFHTFKSDYSDNVGFFFSENYDNAGGYGSTVYEVYLNLRRPLIIDCQGATYNDIFHEGRSMDTYEWADWAKRKGYDGVIFRNIRDGVDYSAMVEPITEFVAFNSNQIKNTTNKTPTRNADIRYSLNLIDNYTEKQYNDFGWARVNDVLTARENADFRSKYAKVKSGQLRANRTKNGEIIIAVNDGKDSSFGVDNVLVYAKGSLSNYKITKVVKINSTNETFLTEAREVVYDCEKRGIQVKASGVFKLHNATDYGYAEFMQNRQGGVQDNAQRSGEQDGRRAAGKTSRASIDVDARLRNRAEILRRYMYSINIAQETKAFCN